MSISTKNTSRTNWKFDFDFNNVPTVRYTKAQEKQLIIERLGGGKREVITFAMAYTELSGWLGRSFANCSDLGFSDALFEIFMSKASVHTPKAIYRLWCPRKFAADTIVGKRRFQ